MPDWNDILNEIKETPSPHDIIRRQYLEELHKITGLKDSIEDIISIKTFSDCEDMTEDKAWYPKGNRILIRNLNKLRRLALHNDRGYWPRVIVNELWGVRYNYN